MRDDYPICPGGSPQVSMLPVELKDLISDGFYLIYAEVSGEETTVTRSLVDEANENMGAQEFDFFDIPLEILYNPSGKFKTGQEVHLFDNTMFRDGLPALEEGDRFVTLVKDSASSHQELSDFPLVGTMEQGFYYITDDGHAIAAYEEPEYFQQNGVGLATLLENYEKIYEEMTAEQTDP